MIGFEIRGKEDVGLRYDVPMPKLHMNEVLIKIKYCGICGSDTHQYHTGIQLQSGGSPTFSAMSLSVRSSRSTATVSCPTRSATGSRAAPISAAASATTAGPATRASVRAASS